VTRWISLIVMMTFFALLPLDIDVPTVNLCLMACLRWAVLAIAPEPVFSREQMA